MQSKMPSRGALCAMSLALALASLALAVPQADDPDARGVTNPDSVVAGSARTIRGTDIDNDDDIDDGDGVPTPSVPWWEQAWEWIWN